ncbi:uncharacterized protein LOC134586234 [Pelobates fuscus]|uniref:uncharacterized protein LOC134586234 n=1 Tax=Pelobates fuscus TaxID=191477 RepID=UPI002FE4AD4C
MLVTRPLVAMGNTPVDAREEGLHETKWIPKSLRNGSGLHWRFPDFQRQSQPGKTNYNSVPLCKPSSAMDNQKEGRVSPEQEAEEMENQYDEEPVSKFPTRPFESQNDIELQQSPVIHENQKATTVKLLLKTNGNKHSFLSPGIVPLENCRPSEEHSLRLPVYTSPLKIPRIILTRPSTSDEDADQLTQDQEDYELEEGDMTEEDHLFLDCLSNVQYKS